MSKEPLSLTLGDVFSVSKRILGEHSSEPTVFSVTKYEGVVRADEYFDKRVASRDLTKYKVVAPGDFVYSTIHIDEGSIGRNNFEEVGVVSPMYTVLRPKPDVPVSPKYLELALRTPQMLRTYYEHAAGSVHRRRSLTFGRFSKIQLSVPQPSEQHRIVDLISSIDAAISKGEVVAELGDQALKDALIAGVSDLVSAHGTKPLGELSTSRLGKMLSKASRAASGESPYLRNANVQWDRIDLGDLNTMLFSEDEAKEFSLRQGDVLVCEGGEVGRAAVVEKDLPGIYFQKALHRVRCGSSLEPRFLMYYLRYCSLVNGFRDYATALTIRHLTGEKLRRLPVAAAPIEQQRGLIEQLDAIARSRESSCLVAEYLTHLRQVVLSSVLSGAHEIPDSYDRFLEEAS